MASSYLNAHQRPLPQQQQLLRIPSQLQTSFSYTQTQTPLDYNNQSHPQPPLTPPSTSADRRFSLPYPSPPPSAMLNNHNHHLHHLHQHQPYTHHNSNQVALPPISSIALPLPSPVSSHHQPSPQPRSAHIPLPSSSMMVVTPTRPPATSTSDHQHSLHQTASTTPEATRTSRARTANFVAHNTSSMICYLWFGAGSSIHPSQSKLQFFPTQKFVSFIQQLLTTTQVSQSVIVLSLHYIYRLKTENPHISAMPGSEMRLAVAALMLANKFLDDNTYTNLTWSQISHIELSEINSMEREFLQGINFKLYVDQKAFDGWLLMLNGLMWAKEKEYEGWRRANFPSPSVATLDHKLMATTTPISTTTNLNVQTHHHAHHRHTPRARSTSPTPTPSNFNFTFTLQPLDIPNPFITTTTSQPLSHQDVMMMSSAPPIPLETRPAGMKRTAMEASFSPDLNECGRKSKRPLSAVLDPYALSDISMTYAPRRSESLGMAMGKMTLDFEQPQIKMEEPEHNGFEDDNVMPSLVGDGDLDCRALSAPYRADEKLLVRGAPKYLTFNTLVASPSVAGDTAVDCNSEQQQSVQTYYSQPQQQHYHHQETVSIPPPMTQSTSQQSHRKTVIRYQEYHPIQSQQQAQQQHQIIYNNVVNQPTPHSMMAFQQTQQQQFANAGPPGYQWRPPQQPTPASMYRQYAQAQNQGPVPYRRVGSNAVAVRDLNHVYAQTRGRGVVVGNEPGHQYSM